MKALGVCVLGFAFGCLACGVVYPEVRTPIRTPPPDYVLVPPPPDDLLYLRFQGAVIPARTVDGRQWDAIGGAAPDPFARLFVNGKEIIVTPVDSDTLRPKWSDQIHANYRIARGSSIKVELWDKNPINNRPICAETIRNLHDQVSTERPLEFVCESGARIWLNVEPARGKLGLGLYYELHTEGAFVTRVLEESPARRAGLRGGEEIVKVQGETVATMEQGKLQSLINANATLGIDFTVKGRDGRLREVKLKDGAIYPLVSEPVAIQ